MFGNYRIVSFCVMCSLSQLRSIAIIRMGKMVRKRKEWKKKGDQRMRPDRGGPIFTLQSNGINL